MVSIHRPPGVLILCSESSYEPGDLPLIYDAEWLAGSFNQNGV